MAKLQPTARGINIRMPINIMSSSRFLAICPIFRIRFALKLFVIALTFSTLGSAIAAPPMVEGKAEPIADGVYIISDRGVALVPNVGIVIGSKSVLVIDTGMGPENAQIVLDEVRRLSDLPIKFLVSTHFHPEHNFGAQTFPQETILIYPEAQHQDLLNKGEQYLELFVELLAMMCEACWNR